MAEKIIFHCGKHTNTKRRIVLKDYPQTGDIGHIFEGECEECKKVVYAYWIEYFDGKCSELNQAGKHVRPYIDFWIKTGQYLTIEEFNRDNKRPTVGHPLVSDATKEMCKDPAIVYQKIKHRFKVVVNG